MRQIQRILEVRSQLPKQHPPAKEMHKTVPLAIDEAVKHKDISGYKAWQNFVAILVSNDWTHLMQNIAGLSIGLPGNLGSTVMPYFTEGQRLVRRFRSSSVAPRWNLLHREGPEY